MANPKIEVEVGAKINDLDKKLGQVDSKLQQTGKQFNKLNEFATGALQGIAAAFTIGAITNFAKAVIDTTAQFQKFEAVLTNTLGSNSEAKRSLVDLQNFAAKTPFAIGELTEAFVKLANQGFKPTTNELRSLGDLASSTGKSFDQLAEAIIDAQVGEFERLKEFGVRAKKEGDNVTFTFKGVETQVKNTESAIRGYILSLGDAEGVSGAMAGISETLGGKISNLGDNIDQLKLAIGDRTSGVFATTVDWLNEFISLATIATRSVGDLIAEVSSSKVSEVIKANREEVENLAKSYQKIDPTLSFNDAVVKAIEHVSSSYRNALNNLDAFQKQQYTMSELTEIVAGFDGMAEAITKNANSASGAKISFEEFSKEADRLNKIILAGDPIWNENNFLLQRSAKLAKEVDEIWDKLGNTILKTQEKIGKVKEFNIDVSGYEGSIETPKYEDPSAIFNFQKNIDELLEFNDVFSKTIGAIGQFQALSAMIASDASIEDKLGAIGEQAQMIQGAFDALGSAVKDAFGQSNSFLGTLLGNLISFAGRIIAQYFAIAAAAALAGASQSAAATGPGAIFTLPTFLALGAGLVAAAFSSIGGGKKINTGSGAAGLGEGTNFLGTTSDTFSANQSISLSGDWRIDGKDLVYIIDRNTESKN